MNLKDRINFKIKKFTKRDINLFLQNLQKFRYNLSRMENENSSISMVEDIEIFYASLLKVINDSQSVDKTDFFRFIALEYLLNSREYDDLIRKAMDSDEYKSNDNMKFNGNLNNDIIVLLKEYNYLMYDYRLKRLQEEYKKNPSNKKLKQEIEELLEEYSKLKQGNLSIYEMTKLKDKQKKFLESLYKKVKKILVQDLSESICLKLQFLKNIGCLDLYVKQYNNLMNKLYLYSVLHIENTGEFIDKITKSDSYINLSVEELMALNAFWTNRLTKEVETMNESIYVLMNINNISGKLMEEKDLSISEEDIKLYLAEYRTIVQRLTQYKLRKKEDSSTVTMLEDSRFASLPINMEEIFSKEDIECYGKDKLRRDFSKVLTLNNFSQLLYDQKDMVMECIFAYLLHGKGYFNSGYIQEKKQNESKVLIGIDLKGYNAPIMLHYHKAKIKRIVEEISMDTKIPLYRGADNFNISSSLGEEHLAPTNILFMLSKEQRLKLMQRAEILKSNDKNYRYVKHIAWMLHPKKEMPSDIFEEKKEIDLNTGEIIKALNHKDSRCR